MPEINPTAWFIALWIYALAASIALLAALGGWTMLMGWVQGIRDEVRHGKQGRRL